MSKIDGIYWSQSKQWLAALAATLAMVSVGTEEFWFRNTLRNMKKVHQSWNNEIPAVVGLSAAIISTLIGSILGVVFAEHFGRKKTLLATSIFAISQSVGSFSANSILSCVTFLLGEIGSGITRVVVPLYVSEMVDDNIRGALLMLQLPFFYIGKLVAVGFENLASTEVVGIVSLILTAIFLMAFTWFPETPYYLASKKRDEAATKSLAFYKGISTVTAREEIGAMMENIESKINGRGCSGKIHELVQPTNRKGLMIIMFLITVTWGERIFDTQNGLLHAVIGTVVSTDHESRIISHTTSLITSLLIVFTIDRIGRRSLLSFSTFVAFIVITSTLILWGRHNLKWLFATNAITIFFCELIVFSVLSVYTGELFTPNVKALAISIVTNFSLLLSFFIIAGPEITRVDMNSFIGGILFLFAFPITFAFIPETKRKSFSDIKNELAITLHSKWLRNRFNRNNQSN